MFCCLEFAGRRHWVPDEGKEEEARLPTSVLLEEEGQAVESGGSASVLKPSLTMMPSLTLLKKVLLRHFIHRCLYV